MANNITFKVGNENSLPSSKTTGQLLFALNGSSGSIYYDKDGSNRIKFNADALKLANKVSINDTEFDGSEGIITNKWGKVREFSISDSANWNVSESVSVDGSTNVTLKMPSTFKMTQTQSIVVEGNANTYYPVVIGMPSRKDRPIEISIHKDLGSQTPSSYEYNHENGTSSLWLLYEGRSGHWDGNGGFLKTLYKYQIYATLVSHAILNTEANGDLIVWLRGGGCYYEISTTVNTNITIYYSETNLGSSTYPSYIAPRTDIGNGGIYSSTYYGYGNLSGDISGTASAVRDKTSGAATYLNHGASGLSTTSWFAAWNGYELRGISPVNSRITMSALSATNANGHYGMGAPDGNTQNWIRTTEYGIIPYQSGGSSALGTESWPFNSVCTNNLYCYGPIRVGNNANGDTNYIAFYGTTGDGPGSYIHTFIGENLYGGSEGSELVIFKGNDVDNNSGGTSGPDRIRHIAASHLFQTYDSALSGTWTTICDSTVPATKLEISPTWIRAHVTSSFGTSSASYALNAASFYCDDWVRTKGGTGWYSQDYGGGWHMNDTIWIRAYNDKKVYVSNTNNDAIYTAGGVKAHGGFTVVQSDVSWNIQNQNSSFTHYTSSATAGHWFNKAVYVQGNIYAGSSYSDLVFTTANYSGYLDPRYVNVSGDTMIGALNFANGTWNKAGDDSQFGDNNTAGSFAIQGLNGATNLKMVKYGDANNYGTITWDGTDFTFSSNIVLAANKHLYMTYNGTNYAVLYNHGNGNVSLRACGSSLFIGYGNTTTGIHFGPSGNWGTITSSGYFGNAATATKLQTARTIFGRSFNGTSNVEGQVDCYGSYTATANQRYYYCALEIRENGLVGNAQSDIGYAPSIGFHWANRSAATLNYHSDGIFYFRKQDGVTRATIDANVNGWASSAGSASTASKLVSTSDLTFGVNTFQYFNFSGTAGSVAEANDTPTSAWWHIQRHVHSNSTDHYYTDVAVPFNSPHMYYKRVTGGSLADGGWIMMYDTKNIVYSSTEPTSGLKAGMIWLKPV